MPIIEPVLLPESLQASDEIDFKSIFVKEFSKLRPEQLPLQQALSYSSYVSHEPFQVIYMSHQVTDDDLIVKTGLFFTGIIAGCSCADDPSPQDTQNEACELEVTISRKTAETRFRLISNS